MDDRNQRGAAFFDLDRTIISGSSLFVFGLVAWRNEMVPTAQLLKDLASAIAFRFTGASDAKTDAVRDRTLTAIAGQKVADLRHLGEQIIPRLLDDVRFESKGLIDLHHDAQRDTYVVSASPIEIVDEFARAMGMTGAIGTIAEVEDGTYTGRLAAPFCYGQGKADAITALAERNGYDLTRSYSYTDSAGDLPMLEIVGHPVAVNPDKALLSIAHRRGWPVVEFARTRKLVIKRTTAATAAAGMALGTYVLGRRHGRAAQALAAATASQPRFSRPFSRQGRE